MTSPPSNVDFCIITGRIGELVKLETGNTVFEPAEGLRLRFTAVKAVYDATAVDLAAATCRPAKRCISPSKGPRRSFRSNNAAHSSTS